MDVKTAYAALSTEVALVILALQEHSAKSVSVIIPCMVTELSSLRNQDDSRSAYCAQR